MPRDELAWVRKRSTSMWARPSIALLVAGLTLASAASWTERNYKPGGGPAGPPTTLEGWLYDYYYNATRLGYDRGEWGGRTVPAMNLRGWTYQTCRAAVRAARVHREP